MVGTSQGKSFFCGENHMTITQILQEIHKLYEKNTSYPDSSSDDYLLRLSYCNAAIDAWENEKGIVWQTLFTEASGTTSNNVSQYNAPSDFIYPSDYLTIEDAAGNKTFYEFCRPEKVAASKQSDPDKHIYWITGGPGAFKINIYPTPTTANGVAGLTYRLPYFKKATKYSTGSETTEPEMMDHYFIIYWALTQLYLDDENTTQANVVIQIAQDKLANMRIKNEAVPFLQPQGMDDIQFDGFGI